MQNTPNNPILRSPKNLRGNNKLNRAAKLKLQFDKRKSHKDASVTEPNEPSKVVAVGKAVHPLLPPPHPSSC